MATEEEIVTAIGEKGAEIRIAKADGASKDAITALVAGLLALKNEYKVIAYGTPLILQCGIFFLLMRNCLKKQHVDS
jgi:WHEP-TRS domain